MVLVGGLLLLEPDFGAFVVIVAIAFGILYLGGLDWRLFLGLLLLLPLGLSAILVAAPYRLQRLVAFLDPWSDPYGKGYQLSHSLIAFGRGEWLGVGLGASVEKLLYLPKRTPTSCSPSLRRNWASPACSRSSGCSSGCCSGRTRSAARRRSSRGRSRRWSRGESRVDGRSGVHQHRRQHGRAPDKGLTLPLLSFGGSGIVANCIALAILLPWTTKTGGYSEGSRYDVAALSTVLRSKRDSAGFGVG